MRIFLALIAAAATALATGFNGTWDATILAGGELVPFRLEVSESPARVCFFEDTQPVCSTSAGIEAGKLIAQWDYLNRELRLELTAGGLQGVYHGLRTGHDLVVQAKPHQPPAKASQPAADLAGEWEIHSKEKPALAWQLLLRQTGHELKGTILRVDGDDGTLVGTVQGKHFLISHFSGDRPVVLEGELADDGGLDLRFEGSALFALRPAAARARNLPPPADPATFARAKDPTQPFRFRLPDLNGRIYTEADFRGKPLVISITGSWCPNCRDEAPFLAELYQRYHAAGLQLAAFCFEPADDTDHAQLRAFLRRFAIRYPRCWRASLPTSRPCFPDRQHRRVPHHHLYRQRRPGAHRPHRLPQRRERRGIDARETGNSRTGRADDRRVAGLGNSWPRSSA